MPKADTDSQHREVLCQFGRPWLLLQQPSASRPCLGGVSRPCRQCFMATNAINMAHSPCSNSLPTKKLNAYHRA